MPIWPAGDILTDGGPGTHDDITVYEADAHPSCRAVPSVVRIVTVWVPGSTPVGGVTVRTDVAVDPGATVTVEADSVAVHPGNATASSANELAEQRHVSVLVSATVYTAWRSGNAAS